MQPCPVTGEIPSRAIEVELELLEIHAMNTRVVYQFFHKIDNRALAGVVRVKRAGVGRDAKGDRAILCLSLDHFPINRGLYDFRFLAGEADLRPEEDNSVHSALRFSNGVNHPWRP